jgi:hypothetical protein
VAALCTGLLLAGGFLCLLLYAVVQKVCYLLSARPGRAGEYICSELNKIHIYEREKNIVSAIPSSLKYSRICESLFL